MKITSAKGITGFLLFDSFTNEPFFRVYLEDGEFKDYDIKHSDLEITITNDSDASFYEDGDKLVLDHDPETLGLK